MYRLASWTFRRHSETLLLCFSGSSLGARPAKMVKKPTSHQDASLFPEVPEAFSQACLFIYTVSLDCCYAITTYGLHPEIFSYLCCDHEAGSPSLEPEGPQCCLFFLHPDRMRLETEPAPSGVASRSESPHPHAQLSLPVLTAILLPPD